ncbi:TonB-dependent receptor [Bacteroidales bacterium OttesenSCG-928-K03]|nr:TonB-dependent receptor [Bacteroidales bacterium OttesenSCG-928-L14]MDL2240337.1 TonB-dependent receptor [Bacteroidales bacterium OttesenSCG-928-K22]MDL2242490.1 TonB-dependent receptor [Bacteroidales bacterium OttesenSCG-928-K03]
MKKILFFIFLFLAVTSFSQKKNTVSGYVTEKGSGESLPGVNVYVKEFKTGTSTNTFGFYSLTLPESDSITLYYSYIGYQTDTAVISFRENLSLNRTLEAGIALGEIVVTGERPISETVQMSSITLTSKEVKNIPALLGEKDVFKVLTLLPGVQSANEGMSGMYVRGGGPDQNLIVLDGATIYNASHLLGFFSVFNGSAIKSVELIKGGFPARYGGRLSSIVDVNMKDGNKQSYHGEGGVGILSANIMVEGPIIKDKSSFMISARRTYFDVFTAPVLAAISQGDETGGYFFHDINAKLNYDFGDKNKLYVSAYFGRDKFYIKMNDSYEKMNAGLYWQNATATVRWNHLFSNRLFSNLSFVFSDYDMNIYMNNESRVNKEMFSMNYLSGIQDYTLKYDLSFLPNPNHTILMGAMLTYHRFRPGVTAMKSTAFPDENFTKTSQIDALEYALYVEDEIKIKNNFKLNPGLRLVGYTTLSGKTYFSAEPRLNASYNIRPNFAVKASYAMMQQSIHLLSSSTIGLPTDLWLPSTEKIRPQQSQQVALGVAYDLKEPKLSFSVEGYYKKMNNILAYKEGSSVMLGALMDGDILVDTLNWEKDIVQGQGWSYGVEFLVRKNVGKFTGWIGYTLAWTEQQFDELNFGVKFPARYDRRHDLSVVLMYSPNDRINLSATWVYATGNAVTMPQQIYPIHDIGSDLYNLFYNNGVDYYYAYYNMIESYGERNNVRMEPFHHLDIGVQFIKKHKKNWESTWEVSVYNIYNRKNAFFYLVDNAYVFDHETMTSNRVYVLKKVSIFPIIPSVSYSFKF